MTDPGPATPVPRSRLRLALQVGLAATVVVGGCLVALRWRADHAHVGTETPAALRWGECLNGIGWTDPANGSGWWAGREIVTTGQYESEPARVPPPAGGGNSMPARSVVHSSIGVMRFESVDRATFTSRTGGTLQFTRPPAEMAYTLECATDPATPRPSPPTTDVWAEVRGVLGHRDPGSDDLVLSPGVVHVEVDGAEPATIPTNGRALFTINVPVGSVTLWGTDARGDCGTTTMTVAAGEHVTTDLLCDRP